MNSSTRNDKFFLALLAVALYWLITGVIKLDGFSFFKIVVTLLLWLSCLLSFLNFISCYDEIRKNLPKLAFNLYLGMMVLNLVSVARALLNDEASVITILGNQITSLSLLVPLSLSFSTNIFNLRIVNRLFINCAWIFLLLSPLYFAGWNAVYYFSYFAIFVITTLFFQSKKDIFAVCISVIAIYYAAMAGDGNRTMLIRIMLLFLALTVVYVSQKLNSNKPIKLVFLCLILPIYLLQANIYNFNISDALQSIQSTINFDTFDSVLKKADTRTFLYLEVFDDLSENDSFLTGKGSTATYYSPYFSFYEGDSSQRLSVEVGFLSLLLKGGFIAVILYFGIFVLAIYHSVFKSNNYYVSAIGLMLLVHVLIFFIENVLSYSIYDFLIWFFIGICLSSKARLLSNAEITCILRGDEKENKLI